MPVHRLELTLSDEVWERLEGARGDVPRAAFVKRALEQKLDGLLNPQVVVPGVTLQPPGPKKTVVTEVRFDESYTRPRPSVDGEFFDYAAAALERQARLNREREKQ